MIANVPLDQRSQKRELWEQPFEACAIDANCAVNRMGRFGYNLCYFKMVAPRALVFRPLVKGNEDSGNESGLPIEVGMSQQNGIQIKGLH